ncbi:hypothetical protein NJB14197_19030 [Mycobacterium montefiorense]|uniref:Uncharacterized protein n=1 Tax=Mycobacterium montefiorense TaxID=154654 RepID=A0AA37PMM7_9MYCO|nr:hypothetical protein MmonteBS_14120 [Mycobacterium montefiorense]GKU36785.1 hypothetical protein NJB14191_41310 [Mycobacterium montefiorense]GKU42904.1 hypothetical protein NJB14192_48870 [Mycobacterium montefiorense]GKU48344.1 hypothetical protein NJB14194_49590 [Mycobacterium montefiorense]GKU50845.1 hypothetical protein NJB14195_20910 [Mycobacterium montefiorense]
MLPVSDSVTGDVAGVVATGPALAPGADEPDELVDEFEPQAAAASTSGAVAARANNFFKRNFFTVSPFP